MKTLINILRRMFIAAVFSLLSSCDVGWVATYPTEPTVVVGTAPWVDGVWIGPEWYWSGGRYIHREGHWEHARRGRTWHSGTWVPYNNGYRWSRGGWRK